MRPSLPILVFSCALAACAAPSPKTGNTMTTNLVSAVRETAHRGDDDLLSAGLGLDGLRGKPPAFADAAVPTPAELRRRAIHTSWQGIADLGPLGGYGTIYGAVPNVPGREYQAFSILPGARQPHRVLLQLPDHFDTNARCVVVAAASGSRGVYGAIALAGAWGLPRGCAVAYTDKGAGSGYYDLDSRTGVTLDGTRAQRIDGTAADSGHAPFEFEPAPVKGATGVAIKHAHSGDNPEADWGRHVLQAAEFALAMLDRAYPAQAPFTPQNTRVIATGVSNGAGAALQAAGIDTQHLLSGVVALAPNVHLEGHGRALYDYVSEAAVLLPCALVDARFDHVPFARAQGVTPPAWLARCARLGEKGLLGGRDSAAQARAAIDVLMAHGWNERAIETAASSTAFDVWRAIAATYASSYLRSMPGAMPCGFRFSAIDAHGAPTAASATLRATWWSDASGIPPGSGIMLLGGTDVSADPTAPGIDCLRALWTGSAVDAQALRAGVAETVTRIPREGLPIIVAQGEDDGLLPIAFNAQAYVAALEGAGREPAFWRVPHAQHFDAFLAVPSFGDRYVPLLPYAYAALDRMWAHLAQGAALPRSQRFETAPRGAGALGAANLALSATAR
ncbi:MAG: 3-hydroxybutyrate oligomer hydrolase family protein [Dokdonella sp.]